MSNTLKQVSRYNDYLSKFMPGFGEYDPTNKGRLTNSMICYMLNRTQSLFKWSGLPDTIPQRMLELYLQINGCCAFMEHEGNLYVYFGGLGGEPDEYYRPTIYTISNPAQKFSVNAKIGVDCVLMRNDSMYMGLLPLHSRYAYNMVETEISMFVSNINSRIVSLISAQDDSTLKSAQKYLNDIYEGKIGVIAENKFLEDLKASQYTNSGANKTITDLIELMQYHKASWYNEIGLNANYNMKRESINADESQLNNDALLPLIDDMLTARKIGADEVNKMFGTSISVDYASAWEQNELEAEKELESINEGGEDNEHGEVLPE